jgi:hypothetical protein
MTMPRRAWWVAAGPDSPWEVMLLDEPADRNEAARAARARERVLIAAALHVSDLPSPPPLVLSLPGRAGATPSPSPRRRGRGMCRKNISRKSPGES